MYICLFFIYLQLSLRLQLTHARTVQSYALSVLDTWGIYLQIKRIPNRYPFYLPKATLPSKTIEYCFARGKNRHGSTPKKKTLNGVLLFAEGRSRTGTWGEPHQILSLARLPISSLRLNIMIKLSV